MATETTTKLGPFEGHEMSCSWREVVHTETVGTYSCSCGYSTHTASEMDSHRHWEMVKGYEEALLDAVALLPPDRWRLLHPTTHRAIAEAQEERRYREGGEGQ